MEKMVSKLPKAENDGRGSVDYGHLVPDVEILQLASNDHTTILKQHLLEQQDGKCCLCERDITKEKQHLDHSHRAPYRDWETDRKSTRLNSSHRSLSRMPSSA